MSNVVVGQGSGNGDSASVTHSTVPGSISITQKDVAGNPGDTALIYHDTVGYTETSGTTVLAAFPGNLTISQGNASIDTATVSNSTALGGNVLSANSMAVALARARPAIQPPSPASSPGLF